MNKERAKENGTNGISDGVRFRSDGRSGDWEKDGERDHIFVILLPF